MKKQQLEDLLVQALTTLLENNGGSMEETLDDLRVFDEDLRCEIKNWYGWENTDEEE